MINIYSSLKTCSSVSHGGEVTDFIPLPRIRVKKKIVHSGRFDVLPSEVSDLLLCSVEYRWSLTVGWIEAGAQTADGRDPKVQLVFMGVLLKSGDTTGLQAQAVWRSSCMAFCWVSFRFDMQCVHKPSDICKE